MAAKLKGAKLARELLAAIERNDFDAARDCIVRCANIHYVSSDGGSDATSETAKRCNELFISADSAQRKKAPACLELLRELLAAGGKVEPGPFQTAAAYGNSALIELLLDSGTDVNELDRGTSAFFNAVMFRQETIAVDLVRRGADPWKGEPLFGSGAALHEAVVAGMTNVVRSCVEQRADLDRRSTVAIGDRPAMTVKKKRDASGAVTATKFEVHPPRRARDATALLTAVKCGHREIVELLAAGGANVELTDCDGFTPLAWALKLERTDLADVLRAAGANGVESLSGSPQYELAMACKAGDLSQARAALARGVDVDACYDDGRESFTPLMRAARKGHADIVAELLTGGADANRGGTDREGFMEVKPLMLAAQGGHAQVVKLLLEAGAELDAERDHIFKHLMSPTARKRAGRKAVADVAVDHAASAGHAAVMKLLLEAQAAKTGISRASGAVVDAAARSGNVPALKVALESRKSGRRAVPSASALVSAVESGSLEAVETLLAEKAEVNGRTRRGETPLVSAVARRDLPMVKLLLEAGANPRRKGDKAGGDELVFAAGQGDANVIRALLEAGADPNFRGYDGDAPLHLAAMFGFPEAVEVLLAGGASTSFKNKGGKTALEKVLQILKGWIGQNPEAAQYKCRDLLQSAASKTKPPLRSRKGGRGGH